jgi:glycerophosphoryl diester phosphodiesterase
MPTNRRGSRRPRSTGTGCLGLVVGLLVIYYGVQFVIRTPALGPFEIIAHRGGPHYAPENTMAAFSNAIAQGANRLEFDVQMTKDGQLVVIHDETLDRTTTGAGPVGAATLAEIKALDAGQGEKVPTFEEVVALAKTAGIAIFPEAKSAHLYPGIEAKMLAVLDQAGYLDHAVIQSFEAASLTTFRQLNPQVKLCALYGLWKLSVSNPPGGAQAVCPAAEMVLLNPGMIRQAHLEGRQVYVWYLAAENPLLTKVMRFFGADGVIVNDPVAAK